MKFSKEKPPNWSRLEKVFNVEWGGSLVVAYGDTIHHTNPIDPSTVIHEGVHLLRQEDPEQWWERYIRDSRFRFEEEILAYREQYKFLKATIKDRNQLARMLWKLASDLSDPKMYNLPFSHGECMKLIKMMK